MSVHRIRIHADRDGDPIDVDLVLPSGAAVGELLPTILGLVDDRSAPPGTAHGWRLDRLSGGALRESLSLTDNGVRDGELLVLAPQYTPTFGAQRVEPCREVAAARFPRHGDRASILETACVLAAIPAAVALAWTGASASTPANLIVAAVGTCAATVSAIVTAYPAVAVAAVALSAATGFLAVPGGPAAPNVLLASAAACAVSLLVLRLSGRPSPVLVGAAAFGALTAVATVIAMPIVAVGTALSVASLGILALAPRIVVMTAGLGPAHWSDEMDLPAATGHTTLTGLVAGCGSGAGVGAALVAVGPHPSARGAVAFTALVGVVLLLRSRTYVDPSRQLSLVTSGFICTAASFAIYVASHPAHVAGACGLGIAVTLVASRRPRLGDALARTVDRLEYVALAAVLPVALWVGGVYTMIGGGRLP